MCRKQDGAIIALASLPANWVMNNLIDLLLNLHVFKADTVSFFTASIYRQTPSKSEILSFAKPHPSAH